MICTTLHNVSYLKDGDLLPHRGHQIAVDCRYGRDGSLLLLVVDRLDLVLGERLPGLGDDLDDVVDADVAARGHVLAVAVSGAEMKQLQHFWSDR